MTIHVLKSISLHSKPKASPRLKPLEAITKNSAFSNGISMFSQNFLRSLDIVFGLNGVEGNLKVSTSWGLFKKSLKNRFNEAKYRTKTTALI